MKQVLVKVSVANGMFPSEKQVTLQNSANESLSLFVDESLLKSISTDNYLKVYSSNESSSLASVLLPSEAFETGSRWVTTNIFPQEK
jgi:hypothetical protein